MMKCNMCDGSGNVLVANRQAHYEKCICDNGEVPPFTMTQPEALEILGHTSRVVIGGHVAYPWGRHSTSFIGDNACFLQPYQAYRICRAIAQQFVYDGIGAVVGANPSGAVLSQWTACHLGKLAGGRMVFTAYAEKIGGGDLEHVEDFSIEPTHLKLLRGRRVLAVDGIATHDGTSRKLVEAVRRAGGDVAGIGLVCNRGRVTSEDAGGVPKIVELISIDIDSWPPHDCPLCKAGVPLRVIADPCGVSA